MLMKKFFLAFAAFASALSMSAGEWQDVKIDLTNGNLLTQEEIDNKTMVNFGVSIAESGEQTRVAADDASANIVLQGKYHSNEHGWGNFSSTIAVEGPVRISMGSCAWGGDVNIKNAAGEVVGTFNTNNGACFHNNKTENIVSCIYKGAATTLTIAGGSYTPYIGVEKVDPSELAEDFTVTFDLGEYAEAGKVPAAETVEAGKGFKLPLNRTLYVEGKTLTGWTDGAATVAPGEEYTPTASVTLTPVFTANAKNLADRTEAVTVKWDFQRQNGAPTMAYQGTGATGVYVTQAIVEGGKIDVKLDFDATSGKIANGNWNDWCQMNGGTKFVIPNAKGALVSIEAYSAPTTTTIDGQTDYATNGNTISYTVGNAAETIEIVIGDGSYYRYIQTVLPVVEAPQGGKTYTDESATVTFAMNDAADISKNTTLPEDAFQTVAFDAGTAQIVGVASIGDMTPSNITTGLKIQPQNGASDLITWMVKPAAGLTFAPKHITGYINRYGTDVEDGVTVSAHMGDGSSVALGTFTAVRQGKDNTQKFANKAIYQYDITLTADQQAALTGSDIFYLTATIGVANTKQAGFGEVVIEGTVNGTIADVEKYTIEIAANPEEGGSVSIYPRSDEYVAEDEVTLTATENFGYDFVSWTNAAGEVVSTEAKFKHTVVANETLTANFKQVNTYELAISVEGGANDYMVSLNPAPFIVDGKNMYEEGTKVTLSASSNKILTFTNWSNGETSSEMAINMTGDKQFTAVYSAVDYIVGWDFWLPGNNGRAADFAAEGNDAVTLNMYDTEGNNLGWLDKCGQNGGYEGRPGGVCWNNALPIGTCYWQTKVDASNFTDVKVLSSMVYNYNAYQKYNVEYSLNGTDWTTVGTLYMQGTKNWTDLTTDLPAECNNQPNVYVRWIADKTSAKDGTSSANDGACIGGTYIIGTAKLVDDGMAPKLVSTVPENNATGASANGKIVLTFDEKVVLTSAAKATLGDVELTPTVSGKTVICEYKGLIYSTDYQFTLAAGSVADRTNNVLNEAVTINFQTKQKPAVEKKLYDFVVPTDGTITEALAAANARGASATQRFRIFVMNGNYVFDCNGKTTGGDGKEYDDPRSYLSAPYVSFIGESMEGVVITNKTPGATWDNGYGAACPLEGIGKGDVLIIQKGGHDTYFQNLTMKSSMGDAHGRDIVLNDQSNKTIMKDACLWGYQDTYVSNNENGKFYFEGGVLRGRTDYLCGKGDVIYNDVTLQQVGGGGYLAVPSKAKQFGYVFWNCYIKKETSDVTFYLGRPWGQGTPTACFINTKMDQAPLGNGWADMSGGWPKRFAEYNSYLTSGTQIDLSGRRTDWVDASGNHHANDPILTLDDVNAMSIANVMGQDDDWDPTELTEQASAPTGVAIDGLSLTWDNSNYALLWAVVKNGKVIAFTTEPAYTVDDASATYAVRAANEMGGLGEATEATVATSIETFEAPVAPAGAIYDLQGRKLSAAYHGFFIQNGKVIRK